MRDLQRRALLWRAVPGLGWLPRGGAVAAPFAGPQTVRADPAAPSDELPAWPALPPQHGRGRHIVILGAGMAGLSAAHALRQAGYAITVLEAGERVGGRVWTLRRGDVVAWRDGTRQTCDFDAGLYFNAGAARILGSHHRVLRCARELGVALELKADAGRLARLWNPLARGGRPVVLRDADSAKVRPEGQTQPPWWPQVVALDLVASVRQEAQWTQQAPMFQPVGGMDALPRALARALGALGAAVQCRCEVQSLHREGGGGGGDGVRIVYRDGRGPQAVLRELRADYCLSTLPLPLLAALPSDLSLALRAGLAALVGVPAVKTAFAGPRFWETRHGQFGGVSLARHPRASVIAPSEGGHARHGVLVYFSSALETLHDDLAEHLQTARDVVAGLYPGDSARLRQGLCVRWDRLPHQRGMGVVFTPAQQALRRQLQQGEGPFLFASDALGPYNGWQESAIASAHRAVWALARRP